MRSGLRAGIFVALVMLPASVAEVLGWPQWVSLVSTPVVAVIVFFGLGRQLFTDQ